MTAPTLRAALLAAGRRLSRHMSEFLELAADFDRSGQWALDGASNCAAWLAQWLDIEVGTAREWLRIAHALRNLDVVRTGLRNGRLSYSKVRVLTRVATPETQDELCALADAVPAANLRLEVARWLARHEPPAELEQRQRDARSLTWHTEADGTRTAVVRLPPHDAAALAAAIDAQLMVTQREDYASADATSPRTVTARSSLRQRRADALMTLITAGGARIATEIVVHVRGSGCEFDDGTPVADSIVERLAPTSFFRTLLHDAERRPINASGRQRHPTSRQRRVVKDRDRVCCDCGSREFLQFDHEPAYGDSHHTVVDELRVRCWKCHSERHRNDGTPTGANDPAA